MTITTRTARIARTEPTTYEIGVQHGRAERAAEEAGRGYLAPRIAWTRPGAEAEYWQGRVDGYNAR